MASNASKRNNPGKQGYFIALDPQDILCRPLSWWHFTTGTTSLNMETADSILAPFVGCF